MKFAIILNILLHFNTTLLLIVHIELLYLVGGCLVKIQCDPLPPHNQDTQGKTERQRDRQTQTHLPMEVSVV